LVIKLCALAEKRGQYQDHSLKNSLIELDDIMQKMYVKRDLGDDLAGYFQQILVEVITPRFTRAEINSALNEA